MLEKQLAEFKSILSDEDLQKYKDDCFWSLIEAVVSADPLSGVLAVKNIKDLIVHFPTIVFWDKMKRYLMGTFTCYEDQVKLASKFDPDSDEFTTYVKRLVHLINAIDDDKKIDYFSDLTRCFLLTELSQPLYFKLSKLLVTCTPEELDFLRDFPREDTTKNTAMVSMLYQYGLFIEGNDAKGEEGSPVRYVLSDFAKALKQNCLNFMEGLDGKERLADYNQLEPIDHTARMRFA